MIKSLINIIFVICRVLFMRQNNQDQDNKLAYRVVNFRRLNILWQSGFHYFVCTLTLSALLLLPAYANTGVVAGRTPDAGSLGNQLRQQQPAEMTVLSAEPPLTLPPATTPLINSPQDSSITVVIKRVQFQGLDDTRLSDTQAQQAIASFLGIPLTFAQLQNMAETITHLAHRHDMPLAYAVLPPQSLRDGILNIRLIPGRYDRAQITNQARIRNSTIARIVNTQAPTGGVILRSRLEHAALLLGSIPGIKSNLVLQPGSISGTSLLNVEITPANRYASFVSIDNMGDPVSGRNRAVVVSQVNGLLGLGDQLQTNVRHSYERNGLLTAMLNYSLLVGSYGTRTGAGYSYLRYRYILQGLTFNGYSSSWNLYLTQPWIRQPGMGVDLRLDVAQQRLNDVFPSAVSNRTSQRNISTGSLSVTGSIANTERGLTEFALRSTVGEAGSAGLTGAITGAGYFSRFNYQLSHLQHISGRLSLFAAIKGQLPSGNMDSSQKFLLGGADAVRAYDTGNGAVDGGQVLTAELRGHWQLPFTLFTTQPELNAAVFYDHGSGMQFKDNLNSQTGQPFAIRNNHLTLSGAGVYISAMARGNYALTVTYARRTGSADPVTGYSGRQRLWLSAVKAF